MQGVESPVMVSKNIQSVPYKNADDLAAMQSALAAWIHDAGMCGYCHVGDVPHRIFNGLRGRYPIEDMVWLWRAEEPFMPLASSIRA